MAELETLHDLLDRLPAHGEQTALAAFDAADRHWSYAELGDLIGMIALDRERPAQSDIPWWRDLLDQAGQDFPRTQTDDTAVLF
jgi:hypothetical protein